MREWVEVRRPSRIETPKARQQQLSDEDSVQRWEDKRRFAHNGRITSFYFTHFPDNFGEKELWGVFQRYGRVWEVFIPSKKDKGGKRFGFERFLDEKDPASLERGLSTIMIGNMKVQVNRPRYRQIKLR